jgi:hypothetical protein
MLSSFPCRGDVARAVGLGDTATRQGSDIVEGAILRPHILDFAKRPRKRTKYPAAHGRCSRNPPTA